MCVCVYTHSIHIYMYVYVNIYTYVWVYIYIYIGERERERESESVTLYRPRTPRCTVGHLSEAARTRCDGLGFQGLGCKVFRIKGLGFGV